MIAEWWPALLIAWSIQAASLLSPGPAVTLLLGVSASRGRGAAVATACGISSAAIVMSLGTVLGVAAIFVLYSDLMTFVRLAGAAFLLWLAFKSFRTAMVLPPLPDVQFRPSSGFRTALTGFFIQLSNPKAIFFWLAIASAANLAAAPWPIVVLFVLGAFSNSLLIHLGWALLLSAAPVRSLYARARRWVEGAIGVFFTIFAIRLAAERS